MQFCKRDVGSMGVKQSADLVGDKHPSRNVGVFVLDPASGLEASKGRPPVRKIDELESLRGIAALFVVLFHLPRWQPWLDIGLINNSYLMVELFFVLSGFVIFNAYHDRIGSVRDLLQFQWLRFGRLYPIHLLFLLGFLALEVGKAVMAGSVTASEPAFSANSPTAAVQQLFLVQAIGPTGNAYSFNSPAWSISTEFYTYLLFAIVLLGAARWRHLVFAALAASAFLMTVWLGPGEAALLFLCLVGFFIGCLLCAALQRYTFELPSWSFALCAAAFVAYLCLKAPQESDWAVFPFSAALIAALLRSKPSPTTGIMRAKVLVWLGSISYSVYMSHSLIISVFLLIMKRGVGVSGIGENYAQGAALNSAEAVAATAACLCAVLFISHLCFRLVEVPFRDWSRRAAANMSLQPSREIGAG
ncbi:acyltransferase family protein [Tsuneonella sp. HG249]